MTKFYALCVGVRHYSNLAEIPGAEKDAASFHRRMVARGVRSQLLTGARATVARFKEELARLARTTAPGDHIILYVAGHGAQDAHAAVEADGSSPEYLLFSKGSLTDRQLEVELQTLAGRRILLLLDACHSAGMAPESFEKRCVDVCRAPAAAWVQILASAAEGAFAAGTNDGGYLTRAILATLDAPVLPETYRDFAAAVARRTDPSANPPVHVSSHPAAFDAPFEFGSEPPPLDEADIQAHTLLGFPQHDRFALLFFRFRTDETTSQRAAVDEFRRAIERGALRVTSAAAYETMTDQPVHALALTHAGLAALGASDLSRVGQYSQKLAARMLDPADGQPSAAPPPQYVPNPLEGEPAFSAGMAARSTVVLGDPWDGQGSFDRWKVRSTYDQPLHGVWIVAGPDADTLEGECARIADALPGLEILREFGYRAADKTEHFGFVEGAANPGIAARRARDAASDARFVPERASCVFPRSALLLSGATLAEQPPSNGSSATLPAWAENGSFLVYRRLNQEVLNFRRSMERLARELGLPDATAAGSLVIGRRPDGTSLEDVGTGGAPEEQDAFDYSRGACPAFAHARKTNPRDGERPAPAIFRRGVRFGEPPSDREAEDDVERGLHFLCYQGTIEGQFETLSRWMNNADFPVAHAGVDGLLGRASRNARPLDRTMPNAGRPVTLGEFVYATGGEYFFAPSLSGLQRLIG